MNRDAHFVLGKLNTAWEAVRAGLQTMFNASDVKPKTSGEIFTSEDNVPPGVVKFVVNPIVFNLPERANRADSNLFIAVTGWLSFAGPDFRQQLRTESFGTQVGYFRSKRDAISHIYGAHYDIDESSRGHPVFHSQVSGQMGLLESVNSHFRKGLQAEDHVKPLLSNVRTPTAQMDVFAVILQLCADHLIDENSPAEVLNAFERMRRACNFFYGAAYRLPYLSDQPAAGCYRSLHWYERTQGL